MHAKSKEESGPRFDFGSKSALGDSQTGTLKELLGEINRERALENAIEIDLKSLGTVFKFLTKITGREYKSITQPLPLSTLKTIKRLHLKNEESGIQLFQYLRSPRDSGKPTMEHR